MSKRKLPKVGIFDPNFSQDPQYGNLSTLKDGLKRIHFHGDMQPTSNDGWYRHQIVIPECGVPTISESKINEVSKITVPMIKSFAVQFVHGGKLEKQSNASLFLGLFENDALSIGPFQEIDGSDGTLKLDAENNLEAIGILNKPIAYQMHENEDCTSVSNLAERGYIILQNYVNLFIGVKNMKLDENITFNVYIDYKVCDTTYQEALIWQADFEKLIDHKLKYRVHIDDITKNVSIISRGELESKYNDDPSKFPDVVRNTSKLFKVSKRSMERAAVPNKELVWAETMKKYYPEK